MSRSQLRRSEVFFSVLGAVMTAGSLFLLFGGVSLVSISAEVAKDPFETQYKAEAIPQITPVPEADPVATPAANPFTAATPILDSNGVPVAVKSLEKAYLLFPAARAVLTKTGNKVKGYPIKFRFEVDPKDIDCTFVLTYQGEIVISKELKDSPTGSYQVSILIRKPGLYIWQVKTSKFESELREVTIKD